MVTSGCICEFQESPLTGIGSRTARRVRRGESSHDMADSPESIHRAHPIGIVVQADLVPELSRVFETAAITERLRLSQDARSHGVMVVIPRPLSTTVLAAAAERWPAQLAALHVSRVAIILGVDSWISSYATHEQLVQRFHQGGIDVCLLHEGQLVTDEIEAWFDRRPAARPFGRAELALLRRKLEERGDAWGLLHVELLAERMRDNDITARIRHGKR